MSLRRRRGGGAMTRASPSLPRRLEEIADYCQRMSAKGLENVGLPAESKQGIRALNPHRLSRDRLKYEHYVCDD